MSLSVVGLRIALLSAAPLQMKKTATRRKLAADCSVHVQRWSWEIDASAITAADGCGVVPAR
jgi:hypothetical protein